MKKLLSAITLCIISICCFGQKQFSLQTGYTSVGSFFFSNNDDLAIGGQWQDSVGQGFTALQQINISADTIALKQKLKLNSENGRLLHLLKKPGSTDLVAIFYEQGCRYAAAGNFIVHLNSAYQIIKSKQRILYFFKNIREPIKSAHFISNNAIVLSTQSFVTTYNITNNKAFAFNDSLSGYDFILPLANSFICLTDNYFRVFDFECDLKGQQIVDFAPRQIINLKSRKGYIAIGKQNLAILNTKGVAIYEHNWSFLQPEFDSLANCFYKNDTLNVVGYKNNNWKLAQLTDQFDFISSTLIGNVQASFSSRPFTLNDIFIIENKIHCLKQFELNNQKIDVLEIYKRDTLLLPNKPDIAINKLVIDSIKSNSDNGLLHSKFYSKAAITNTGNDTIRSFYLNWASSANTDCTGHRVSKQIKTLLEPNATDTLSFEFIDSFLLPKTTYEVCLSLTSPNAQLDTFWLNNTRCTSVLLPTVSVNEHKLSDFNIPTLWQKGEAIFCNDFKTVQLFDMNGKAVLINLNSGMFHFSDYLNTGPYIVVFKSDTKLAIGKIVIVN
ncbi:MAG: hypothetical protein ACPGLV_03420 [Bacteroidia bacterium]